MFLKDAHAVIDYRVDWTAALADEVEMESSSWSVSPAELGGILVVDERIAGAFADVRLGGGLPGHVYRVANRVSLSDGSTDERSLAIRVEER